MLTGEWRAHPSRVATAALAIAVGVALGFAVHLINASAQNEFAQAIASVNGEADLTVEAVSPRGFDEALYPRLARLDGVAQASPVVELAAAFGPGPERGLRLLGLDVLRAAAVTPALIGRPQATEARGPADETLIGSTLFLSPAALEASRKTVGDTITLTARGHTMAFVVGGTLPMVAEGQRVAVIDIAEAQWRFGSLGRLQRIDLKLAEGADAGRVAKAAAALLPAEASLAARGAQVRRSDNLSRAYRVNLDMLALVALLTGGFLVYSAQSLSVARRRPQFALVRVLGAPRRAVLGQVMAEGLVVGGIGAAGGLALGLAFAAAALAVLGGDLGGVYFAGARPDLVFAPGAAAVFFALGLASALAGSLIPAYEAARAHPAIALKAQGDAADPTVTPRAGIALGLLAAGGVASFLPAVGGLPLFGYLAIGLTLAGGVAAMPWLARTLLSPLQRLAIRATPVDLALKRLWGAPSQAAVALCGIVASTSLMIAMAVMVSSFRGSVDDWLTQALPADLYLRIDAAGGGLDGAAQARLAATPGIESVRFMRMTPIRLSPEQPPAALMAAPIDRADPGRTLPLIGRSKPVPAGAVPVWVSEAGVWAYGAKPGTRLKLPIGGRRVEVFVAGVWRDYARQTGAFALDAADYQRLTGDATRTEAAVFLLRGVTVDHGIAAVRAALPKAVSARAEVVASGAMRKTALAIFDRSFAVTYVLEAVAIVVGLAGVAATVSAQTLARTKEFGMLRHLGVLRGQVVAMLGTEGALLGAVGVVAGLTLGVAMSQILIHVVNPQSFHWTMETRLPWGLFAVVGATLVASAAGAALIAGRRALSADAVRAVREDW
jgi:putative ABC transport system permease protein